MPLPSPLRDRILHLLRTRLDAASLDELLQSTVNQTLDALTKNASFIARTLELVNLLERDPSALRSVLIGLAELRKDLAEEINQLLDEAVPTDDRLMVRLRFGGKRFADRASFRRIALALAEDQGPRVLRVGGDRGVGKSHCWYFLEGLRGSKAVRPVLLDLDEWDPDDEAEVPAGELAAEILSKLGLPSGGLGPDPTVGAPRGAKEVVRTLTERLVAAQQADPSPIWIFLDHAYRARLGRDAREFITLLARKAMRNEIPGLRLIVIDPQAALSVEPSVPPVHLLHVTPTDLAELLSAELRGLAIDPATLGKSASDVLFETDLTLEMRIQRALDRLREGQP